MIENTSEYKLYENSIYYILEFVENLKIKSPKRGFSIPKLKINYDNITLPMPSTLNLYGAWGKSNLICFVANMYVEIFNDDSDYERYTIRGTKIIIPKIY